MIRLLTAVLLLTCSLFVWASVYPENYGGVPHPNFKQGDVIDHEKFNANNLSIKNAINANKAALPPTNCSTDQIIEWDASNEAWACANLSGPQLETVTVDCTAGFATPETCSASCAGDKQLVSGGCQFNFLNQAIYLQSIPNGNSWSCGIGNGGAGSHVDSAYAICQ